MRDVPERLRILYLTFDFPYPPDRGSRLRTFSLLRGLAEYRHRIYLLSFVRSPIELRNVEAISRYTEGVEFVPLPNKLGAAWRVLSAIEPMHVAQAYSREFIYHLERILDDFQPQLVICEKSHMARYAELCIQRGCYVALDQQDIDREMWETLTEHSRNPFYRLFARVNGFLVRRYDDVLYQQIALCLSGSEQDAGFTREHLISRDKVVTARQSVDTTYYAPERRPEPANILLTGGMDRPWNIDAAVWFYEEVLDIVRQRIPTVQYITAGRDPAAEVRALAERNQSVIVTGRVSDMRPYFDHAAVCVAPYRMGSGVKYKVLIAMAMACPMVATDVALQGIVGVESGKHALIANSASDFAEAVISLVEQPVLAERIGNSAREFVSAHYSWSSTIATVNKAMGALFRSPKC